MLIKFMPLQQLKFALIINANLISFGMSVFYGSMKVQAKFLDLHFLWKERKE